MSGVGEGGADAFLAGDMTEGATALAPTLSLTADGDDMTLAPLLQFPDPRAGLPPSIEVPMSTVEEISAKLTDIRVIVARLDESNRQREKRDEQDARLHDGFETRLTLAERAISDARATVGLVKWLVATTIATAGVALAAAAIAIKALFGG